MLDKKEVNHEYLDQEVYVTAGKPLQKRMHVKRNDE